MARTKGKKRAGQVTIIDVADRAGVSIATVSRVLNASARVDADKREKVETAVRELGFAPKAAARALAGQRTRCVGLLVPEISGEFFTPMLKGIEAVLRAADYGLLIETTGSGRSGRATLASLGEHNTDGLLLFADSAESAIVEGPASRGFPLVLLYAAPPTGVEVPCVTVEDEEGSASALRHLVREHGRRRVLCFTGPSGNHDAAARLRGYRRALREEGIPFDPALLAPGDFSAERAAASIRELLGRRVAFDAVLACDDGAALGAMAALAEAGLAVGKDLSVVGFDDQSVAARASPPLATVRAPTEEVGAEAARLLLALASGATGLESRVFPTEFVPRESCGCGRGGRA